MGHAITVVSSAWQDVRPRRDQYSKCVIPALAALARRRTSLRGAVASFTDPEPRPLANGKKPPVWFALDETRSLACFAGFWTQWTSVRKVKEGEVTAKYFAFLTTEPNREVAEIHPKAMPVILTLTEQIDVWMATEMPSLAEHIEASGLSPVIFHLIGIQPEDLEPATTLTMHGFTPKAQALVFNEFSIEPGLTRDRAFDRIMGAPSYGALAKASLRL